MRVGRKHTFPSALEEEAHNKDLQRSHGNHHQRLNHTEVEDPTLGTAHSTEVPVLTGTEVLLVAGDGRELCGQLVDRLLQAGSLFGAGALAGGQLGALLVLDLWGSNQSVSICWLFSRRWEHGTYGDLEVDHFLGKGRHLIIETEGVLAETLCGEHEVSLSLLCAI
jgi:hypothetical protein